MSDSAESDSMLHWGVRCRKRNRIVAVASGFPEFAKHAAKHVAQWIREGEQVERVMGATIRRDGIDHGPECSVGRQMGFQLEG